jgi:hypothetical protein
MKRLIVMALIFSSGAVSVNAQEIRENAIGLRLGENDGFGGEVTYQRALKESNRLEFDLGWRDSGRFDAVKAIGLYQWVWNIQDNFNWYAGPGVGIGAWRFDDNGYNYHNGDHYSTNGSFAVLTGDIGIEYLFDIPLQLSLDFRPEFYLGDKRGDFDGNYNNFGPDLALGVRFTF